MGFKTDLQITRKLTITWDSAEEMHFLLSQEDVQLWNAMTQSEKDFVVELIGRAVSITRDDV